MKLFKLLSISLLCVDFFRLRSLNMWSPPTWRKTWTKHSAKSFLMFNWPSAKSEGTGFQLHNLKIFISNCITYYFLVLWQSSVWKERSVSWPRRTVGMKNRQLLWLMSTLKNSPCTVNWTSRIANFALELVSYSLPK